MVTHDPELSFRTKVRSVRIKPNALYIIEEQAKKAGMTLAATYYAAIAAARRSRREDYMRSSVIGANGKPAPLLETCSRLRTDFYANIPSIGARPNRSRPYGVAQVWLGAGDVRICCGVIDGKSDFSLF